MQTHSTGFEPCVPCLKLSDITGIISNVRFRVGVVCRLFRGPRQRQENCQKISPPPLFFPGPKFKFKRNPNAALVINRGLNTRRKAADFERVDYRFRLIIASRRPQQRSRSPSKISSSLAVRAQTTELNHYIKVPLKLGVAYVLLAV